MHVFYCLFVSGHVVRVIFLVNDITGSGQLEKCTDILTGQKLCPDLLLLPADYFCPGKSIHVAGK